MTGWPNQPTHNRAAPSALFEPVPIACDFVVMAVGARSVSFDTAALSDTGIAVVSVGDCLAGADISHATKTPYIAANVI